MRILVAVGTRPEAVKLFPVIQRLGEDGADIRVCLTSQHRDLLRPFIATFNLPVHHDLDVMQVGQTLSGTVARILEGFDRVLLHENPDWVVVQGDTSTALGCALAAHHRGIRVAHVEAGLRTYDKRQPFPEETNRRLITHLADRHFAPTQNAAENLLREGIDPAAIVTVGNTVIDTLFWAVQQTHLMPSIESVVPGCVDGRRIVLVTIHRRENFGAPLRAVCRALIKLAHHFRDEVHFVFPVHPNPLVRESVYGMLGGIEEISLVEPLDYLSFVRLLSSSYLVLTDSGGVQEEAPALNKPVLVLRETTERPEGTESAAARLVGTCAATIVRHVSHLLRDRAAWNHMSNTPCPYGDGHAAEYISRSLLAIEPALEGVHS